MEEEKLIEKIELVLDEQTFGAIHIDHIRNAAVAAIREVRKHDKRLAKQSA